MNYCKFCGSVLGIDCGDAEPDYNKDCCSIGCYKILERLEEEEEEEKEEEAFYHMDKQ